MNLHVQLLRPSNALGTLRRDGWEFSTSGIHYQGSAASFPPLQKIEAEFVAASFQLAGKSGKLKTCPHGETWIFAKHADVPDEIAARRRLDHLNLLTSGSIRIDFQDFRRRIRAAL